jgi:DNA polymerase-4
MRKLIFHIDVNSAYLSWEAARRVANGEPDLRLIPSAIGGDPEKRTGVILAKSIPAKKFKITTGEPVAMALRKCPDLVLAKPDFKLYVQNSRAFIAICKKYAPVVEQVSIDECFCDFDNTELVYPDPLELAYRIKDEIKETLGFTVNVGISENKLLAKMASDFEKPDKVHTLYPGEIPEKMWPLPVGELFTVGKATAERLRQARIETVGALAHTDPAHLERMFGPKMGSHLHRYANGIRNSPVLAEPEEAKGYSISTTLEDDVETAETAHHILLALADSVAARMRADGFKTFCVAVSIRSNDFKNKSHQQKLREPTDGTNEIYQLAKKLFSELWNGKTPLRLLGIALTDLTKEDFVQTSLFDTADERKTKSKKLDKAVDALRSKFGRSTIQRGALLQDTHEVGKKYTAQMEQKTTSE